MRSQSAWRRGDTEAAGQYAPHGAAEGVERASRLLPQARALTSDALSALAARYGVGPEQLARARARIEAVTEVRLDESLGELAEFDEDEPSEIRVGEDYARDLSGDDDAVVLLSHELTHAAAVGDDLDGLIDAVAAEAGKSAGVFAEEDQKEDLFCDYVGLLALKRFSRLQPDGETLSARAERVFVSSIDGADEEDDEHLSPAQTWQALRGLDDELK